MFSKVKLKCSGLLKFRIHTSKIMWFHGFQYQKSQTYSNAHAYDAFCYKSLEKCVAVLRQVMTNSATIKFKNFFILRQNLVDGPYTYYSIYNKYKCTINKNTDIQVDQ